MTTEQLRARVYLENKDMGAFSNDHQKGLTKREYIATLLMQGMMANGEPIRESSTCLYALNLADQLLWAMTAKNEFLKFLDNAPGSSV